FFIQQLLSTPINSVPTSAPTATETPNSETPSNSNSPTSAPSGGGDYSNTVTITPADFNPSNSATQTVQEVLHQAQNAIQSQQIPQLESAESKITSLFSEPNPAKKQVYYQFQPQLEDKLEKVLQTKTIQEIKFNHLDIAQQIQSTIEPTKINQKC